jgi:hypothetical protein
MTLKEKMTAKGEDLFRHDGTCSAVNPTVNSAVISTVGRDLTIHHPDLSPHD